MKNNAFVPAGIIAYSDFLLDPRLSLATKSMALIFKVYEGQRFTGKEFAKMINVTEERFCSMICELISAGYVTQHNDGSFEINTGV